MTRPYEVVYIFDAALEETAINERLARFHVEKERTEKILQIKRGERPAATSRCTDGTWLIGDAPMLKFSRDIAVSAGAKYPLEYSR